VKQRFVFWSCVGFIGLYLSALINFNAFNSKNISFVENQNQTSLSKSLKSIAVESIYDVSSNAVFAVKGKTTLFVDNPDFYVKAAHGVQILLNSFEYAIRFNDSVLDLFEHLSKILYPFHSFW
jgi:hypothetical protein